MKSRTTRRTLFPLALGLAAFAPALVLGGAGPSGRPLDVTLGVRTASAQPADDGTTKIARQLFETGVKAFRAGKWDEARAAFYQAWDMKKHPAVLLNLGQAELKGGHPEDAGNHLSRFLREYAEATPEQRKAAEQGIAEARKKAGVLEITVDAPGAEVSVDGTAVGKSPLPDPVFVKPGKRTVFASLGDKTATTEVEAKAGAATPASLTIGAAETPPAGPVTPADPGTPPPGEAPAGQPAAAPYPPGGAPAAPPPQPDRADADGERGEGFFGWYAQKPLAWVTTGVAAVGLGVGIGFTIAATSASGAATDKAAALETSARGAGVDRPCGDPAGGGDHPRFAGECDALRSDIDAYDRNVLIATGGWVLLGVGAAATVVYYFVDSGKSPSAEASVSARRAPPRRLVIAPAIGPRMTGLGVAGSF